MHMLVSMNLIDSYKLVKIIFTVQENIIQIISIKIHEQKFKTIAREKSSHPNSEMTFNS